MSKAWLLVLMAVAVTGCAEPTTRHARLVSLADGQCTVRYFTVVVGGLLRSDNAETRRWAARTLPNGALACFIDEVPDPPATMRE